jgi:hypothetical protein
VHVVVAHIVFVLVPPAAAAGLSTAATAAGLAAGVAVDVPLVTEPISQCLDWVVFFRRKGMFIDS